MSLSAAAGPLPPNTGTILPATSRTRISEATRPNLLYSILELSPMSKMESLNATMHLQTAPSDSDVPSLGLVQALILLTAFLLTSASLLRAAYHLARTPVSMPSDRLSALGIFAGVLLYCFTADRTSLFHKLPKQSDELTFLVTCSLALLSGLTTVRRVVLSNVIPEKTHTVEFELLSRYQTEEWKGWMQTVILLYHYFGMSKVLHIYRVVRLLVGSYLFLTGYGHTTYFLRTGDFSLRRVAAVLIRLNFLACLLPFVMSTKYQLYYFPALSTFWFLVTWVVVPRAARGATNLRAVIWRILAAASATELLFLAPGIWGYCAECFRSVGMVDLDAHELVFRLSLDRYIAYVGMLAACANENIRRTIDASDIAVLNGLHLLDRRNLLVALCTLCLYLIVTTRLSSKESSNRVHAFVEAVPILVFVLIRNATPTLRRYQSRLFGWIGKYSLETFILQYHIWLGSDTKELLSLGISSRSPSIRQKQSIDSWLEWCLLSIIFLVASSLAGNATSSITAWMVGRKHIATESNNRLFNEQPEFACLARLKQSASNACQLELSQTLLLVLVALWLLNATW